MILKKRFVCDCDPEYTFNERFEFIRKYHRQTAPFEKYVFTLNYENTVKSVSEVTGISKGTCQRIYKINMWTLCLRQKT